MEVIGVTELRKNMKRVLDKIINDGQEIIIHRANQEDVLLVSLSEYNSLVETSYLLSTKNNRDHLFNSIKDIKKGNIIQIDTENLWK